MSLIPFLRLLKPFKHAFLMVALLSFVTNLLMLVPTVYMLQLYDRVMLSLNTFTLIAITLMVSFLLLMMGIAEWIRSQMMIRTGVAFDQTYGKRVFASAFGQSTLALVGHSSQLLTQLTQVRQFMTGNGLFAFFDLPWSVMYVLMLFILSPTLGVTAIAFCTIQFALAVLNQRVSVDPMQTAMDHQTKNDVFLLSKVRHLSTLYVLGMVEPIYKRWAELKQHTRSHDEVLQHIQNRQQFINKISRYIMQSAMLAVAAVLVIQHEISVGSMIASNVLIGRALQPFDVIVATWRQWMEAKNAAITLMPLIDQVNDVQAITLKHVAEGKVSLTDVSVRMHANQRSVLHHLTFETQPGRIMNIMGASGSGKTTLAKVLLALVTPHSGQVTIDSIPVHCLGHAFYADHVGYLPQQVDLMEGTIAENIARFHQVDSLEVIKAAKAVGMHEAILRFPSGYDTWLTSEGLPLSGGQKQLLGLARAIYREPSMLILDEPNANLDEQGEILLTHLLREYKHKLKTIVLISHRSSLLKVTDDLLILKNGEVAHWGPREAGVAYLNQQNNIVTLTT